jgi:hypothetical protein
MTRSSTSWSVFVDQVEGPCVVCGVDVRYMLPSDRPTPALLYHATCDPTPFLRAGLKEAAPPLLPPEFTIHSKK